MGFVRSLKKALTSSGFFVDQTKKFDADDELMAELHSDAHEEGGLACNDKQLLAEMRECIMQWIKSMGRQILQGNLNLVNTSFPVRMFEPRSYLQKMADIWAYPDYINAAAACSDPLERMKLLVTWLVAGLHHGLEHWKKPFNPIIGETWQATMPGGLCLYMEQISHHPPVSAYQLEGPGWTLCGWSQPAVVPVVKFYGIKTVAKGERHITFADGSTIKVATPHFAIKGVVYAAKPHAEVLGVARLLDEQNHLEAVISFGPVPHTRQRMLARADAVCGEVYQLPRAAHLQDAATAGPGALQRSATAATALSDLNADVDHLAGSLESTSVNSDAPEAAADAPDPDDEAILAEFNAQHFAGDESSAASSTQAAAVARVTSSSCKQQPSSSGMSSSEARHSFHRSKSSILYRQEQQNQQHSSHGRKAAGGAVVPGVAVARIEGNWLSHLNIDNSRYWTLSEATPQQWQAADKPLPSDLRFRQDLAALAAGDLAGAQHYKEVGEHQQRADRRLREAAGVYEH